MEIIKQALAYEKAQVRTSIATVLSELDNNCYELQTEGGHKFIGRDENSVKPAVGSKVFYNQNNLAIIEPAPNIPIIDIPV